MTSKESLPLVSVYMPTKNRLALLKRAVASIQAQTYPNIEIIIVNDGSTDGTLAYLEALSANNPHVTFISLATSGGACAARNKAIDIAKGHFITGLDDDDEFLPHRIESLVSTYDDKYAFICSSMWWDYGKKKRLIDGKAKIITLAQQLSYNEATSQVLVETERVKALGGFDETFVACQDYDLFTRLIIEYGPAYRIAEPSYVVNDTGSSERMIASPKSVKGYQQYFAKFDHLMSRANKNNQAFMQLRREKKPLTLTGLMAQIGSGHLNAKLRYFLSSNFTLVRSLHQKYYK